MLRFISVHLSAIIFHHYSSPFS